MRMGADRRTDLAIIMEILTQAPSTIQQLLDDLNALAIARHPDAVSITPDVDSRTRQWTFVPAAVGERTEDG